jgi:hypothetical protein
MPLTVGRKYQAKRDLPCFDSDDRIPARVELLATKPDELVDPVTGTVYRLMDLQRNRTEWWFRKTDEFNCQFAEPPTLREFEWELVRAYPDLLMNELHQLGADCNPRDTMPRTDAFSRILSEEVRLEMFKDGTRVERVGHNARYCTFRPKGWQPGR